ncbi:hypothetical protein [Modestobacter roseus]|uniref:hypothetical protein n=1 Tax=Modestobacter roseus TaxID=1181884 RepID=UPI0012961F64|nr:hypothetical protein [Modestobacter roseus]MQA36255.1 hypothetical protein [Modestobacter roseus]
MNQDASPRLHVVTGNAVAPLADAERPALPENPVMADLMRRAEALDARAAAGTTPRAMGPAGLLGSLIGLTVLLTVLGRQPWQLPGRDGGGVSDVPQSLVSFLLISVLLCLCGARLVRPARLLPTVPAVRLWWALVLGSAAVSVAAALSLASFSTAAERPADLLVRCLVPVVPAVLAGLLASTAGRAVRVRLALGTGLVTVPLTGLGWALLSSAPVSTATFADVLAVTGIAGAAPLAVAVAFVAADRHTPGLLRFHRAPSEA